MLAYGYVFPATFPPSFRAVQLIQEYCSKTWKGKQPTYQLVIPKHGCANYMYRCS